MNALGMPAGDLRRPLPGLDADAVATGMRIVPDLELDREYGYDMKHNTTAAA
jgi:4-hydroxy-tetrahydrodipicolinate synthase